MSAKPTAVSILLKGPPLAHTEYRVLDWETFFTRLNAVQAACNMILAKLPQTSDEWMVINGAYQELLKRAPEFKRGFFENHDNRLTIAINSNEEQLLSLQGLENIAKDSGNQDLKQFALCLLISMYNLYVLICKDNTVYRDGALKYANELYNTFNDNCLVTVAATCCNVGEAITLKQGEKMSEILPAPDDVSVGEKTFFNAIGIYLARNFQDKGRLANKIALKCWNFVAQIKDNIISGNNCGIYLLAHAKGSTASENLSTAIGYFNKGIEQNPNGIVANVYALYAALLLLMLDPEESSSDALFVDANKKLKDCYRIIKENTEKGYYLKNEHYVLQKTNDVRFLDAVLKDLELIEKLKKDNHSNPEQITATLDLRHLTQCWSGATPTDEQISEMKFSGDRSYPIFNDFLKAQAMELKWRNLEKEGIPEENSAFSEQMRLYPSSQACKESIKIQGDKFLNNIQKRLQVLYDRAIKLHQGESVEISSALIRQLHVQSGTARVFFELDKEGSSPKQTRRKRAPIGLSA